MKPTIQKLNENYYRITDKKTGETALIKSGTKMSDAIAQLKEVEKQKLLITTL